MPRWSVLTVHEESGTKSMAGLPDSNTCVCVGPPLFASGPIVGLVLFNSPVPTKAQEESLAILYPREVMARKLYLDAKKN